MATPDTVFVSYARTDRASAGAVVDALRAAGLTVWWDADMPEVTRWQDELQTRLGECSACLVLIGTQGVSGWVRAEVGVALNRHFSRSEQAPIAIVPVLLGDAPQEQVPPFLALFQSHQLPGGADRAEAAALAAKLRDGLLGRYQRPALPAALHGCPFPGLAPFEEAHQSFFLGRHLDLHAALHAYSQPLPSGGRRRWLRIEGDSGLGKSSLLRAGVLPALAQGWLELGSPDARLRVLGLMRPGGDPLFSLAGLLARAFGLPTESVHARLAQPGFRLAHLFAEHLPGDGHALPLLAVDQLEELFSLTRDREQERLRFDALLADAVADPALPLYLVTTMRSDFLPRLEAAPRLDALANSAARCELKRMGEAGLRDVVVRGVALAGLKYSDDQLAEDILDEARHESGALPLVSNLLRLLCEQGGGTTLERGHHKALGGLGGALAESADALLRSLGEARREKALRLLLALVEPGVHTAHSRRSITRRQAIAAAGGGEAAEVLDRLSGHADAAAPRAESGYARLVLVTPTRPAGEDDAGQSDEGASAAGDVPVAQSGASSAAEFTPPQSPAALPDAHATPPTGRSPAAATLQETSPPPAQSPEGSPASDDDSIDLIHETLLRTRPDGTAY